MNKFYKLLLLTILVNTACSNDDSANCDVMKEAIIRYGDDFNMKRIFVHDGTHYTEYRDYYYDQANAKFNDEPNSITTITYSDGKASTVIKRGPYDNSDTYYKFTYTYDVDGDITNVNILTQSFLNNTIVFESNQKSHFIESPKPTIYLTENEIGQPILEQYENGNLMQIGFQSATGDFVAYDTTWSFSLQYTYDTKPNVVDEFVLYDLFTFVPNGGYCANNVIKLTMIPEEGTPITVGQSFQLDGLHKLAKYVYDGTGRNVSITYDCD